MLAIIDGDVLAYQACKSRYGSKIQLDEFGNKIPQQFTKEEDTKYLRDSWKNFKKDLENLVDSLYCTDYVMAVKGVGCFRHDLYPDYKAHRSHKPEVDYGSFVPAIRELAVLEEYAIPAHGREADDLICTWATEARRAGVDHVVCSIDKDLKCIPGHHFIMHYHEDKKGSLFVTPFEAKQFYYSQLIMGDPTDNIPGVPQVGKVKAAKLISGCVTETDMQEAVVEQYLVAYGDAWYDYFLLNAKLIHLQTHADDYFDCRHWPIIQELC